MSVLSRAQIVKKLRKPRVLEKSIEDAMVKLAKDAGCLSRKMSGLGFAGWPDRMFILPLGTIWWVEVKRPGGKLTPGQEEVHRMLREHHQYFVSVHVSVEEFRDDLESMIRLEAEGRK